jgi:hypothetical protein
LLWILLNPLPWVLKLREILGIRKRRVLNASSSMNVLALEIFEFIAQILWSKKTKTKKKRKRKEKKRKERKPQKPLWMMS